MAKPKQPTSLSPDEIELLLESIALDHLFIETLQTRHRDSLDFHDVGVWCVRDALQAAYEAGIAEGRRQAGRMQKQGEAKQ